MTAILSWGLTLLDEKRAGIVKSHAVLISLAMLVVPRLQQMASLRTHIVAKTGYFTKRFMISLYLGVICKNMNVNGVN